MFMRYFGGGIGHATTPIQSTEEDTTMNVDEEVTNEDLEDGTSAGVSQPTDHDLLAELRQTARLMEGGGVAGDREDVQDPDDGDESDSDEDMDDGSSVDGGSDDDDNLGPEDGEDREYFDSGYDAL